MVFIDELKWSFLSGVVLDIQSADEWHCCSFGNRRRSSDIWYNCKSVFSEHLRQKLIHSANGSWFCYMLTNHNCGDAISDATISTSSLFKPLFSCTVDCKHIHMCKMSSIFMEDFDVIIVLTCNVGCFFVVLKHLRAGQYAWIANTNSNRFGVIIDSSINTNHSTMKKCLGTSFVMILDGSEDYAEPSIKTCWDQQKK